MITNLVCNVRSTFTDISVILLQQVVVVVAVKKGVVTFFSFPQFHGFERGLFENHDETTSGVSFCWSFWQFWGLRGFEERVHVFGRVKLGILKWYEMEVKRVRPVGQKHRDMLVWRAEN